MGAHSLLPGSFGKVGGLSLKNGVIVFTGTGAPVNGTSGTGVGKAGPGSFYIRTNGAVFTNTNTKASPTWTQLGTVPALTTNNLFIGVGGVATDVALSGHATLAASGAMTLAETIVKYDEIAIPSADIVSATAGKLSHAAGQILVAAPAAGKAIEFISATLIYDYAGAAYGGGGDLTIRFSGGGTVLSATVTAANSFGSASDKVAVFQPLDTAGGILLTTAAGLNLVSASVPFTLGSATGVGRVKVSYRIHTTGL